MATATCQELCCDNVFKASIMSMLNRSVTSVVVTIESALVLIHILWMSCQWVFNNPSSTLRMASAIAGGLLYRPPLPRDLSHYTVDRYIPLHAKQFLAANYPLSPGRWR